MANPSTRAGMAARTHPSAGMIPTDNSAFFILGKHWLGRSRKACCGIPLTGTWYGTVSRRSAQLRSEEHTSELQSLMRISYAVFFLKKTIKQYYKPQSKI